MMCTNDVFRYNTVRDRDYVGASSGIHIAGFYNATADFNGPMAVGLVYRGNTVDDGVYSIQGAVSDVLYEGNVLTNGRQCNTQTGACTDGLQVMNGRQPDGATNITTVFRVHLNNNTGL